jgi:serine/threonine protein kinase
MISEVGEALVYVHGQNIIHGNIKPENILLDNNGQAVLTDFHLVDRKDAIVRDQTSEEYSFCYLAPEQFAGTCDTRSDQYALGCLTYELITGRVPFAAQSLTSMMGPPSHAIPASLSESMADLPPSLEAAVLKTLAKDPAERFYDFSLFLEVIRAVLSPPPAFPLARSARPRRNRAIAHPLRSTEAGDVSSPISNHTALSDPMPEPPELSRASSSAEVEAAVLENASSMSQVSMPESLDMASLSESLEAAFEFQRFPFSLSGEAYPIDDTENEKKADDLVLTNPFVQEEEEEEQEEKKEEEQEEEANILPEISSVSAHEYSEYVADEDTLSLPMRPAVGRSQSVQAIHSRRVLGLALLLSGIVALIVYICLPLVMSALNTSSGIADKQQVVIPQITGTSTEQIPVQVAIMPTVQPSLQATTMPTAQPSPRVNSIPVVVRPKGNPPIQPPPPTPTPVVTDAPTSYEAEASANTIANGAQVLSCSSCSGGYRVGYIGMGTNGSNGTLQINNVNKISTGSYTLTLYYSNGSSGGRDLYISVNGGSTIVFNASPTGSYTTFATAGIAINLNAGSNTIQFSNPQGPTPDIDKIIV